MAINLLSALGSVSGTMYSRKMAIRAQKNFQNQLDLKREIETGKLDLAERKQKALEEYRNSMLEISNKNARANLKRANTGMREIRLKENKFKDSLAKNTTDTMKEGEQ